MCVCFLIDVACLPVLGRFYYMFSSGAAFGNTAGDSYTRIEAAQIVLRTLSGEKALSLILRACSGRM